MNLPLNIDVQQILLHILNFVLLFGGLYFILYKPVKQFMDKRADEYRKIDEDTAKARIDADAARAVWEEKLRAADADAAEKLAIASETAAAEADRIRAEAQKDADELLATARRNAAKERELLLRDANREISELAADAAKKIVFEKTSDAYDSFLTEAERSEQDA